MTRKILEDSLLRIPEDYDSEVIELVQALELAEIGSPAWREWFACYVESCFSRYWLCERYRNALNEKRRNMQIRCEMFARQYRPYSHYVHEPPQNYPDLFR